MSEMTAYDAVGGDTGVRAAVDLFYDNLLGDISGETPVSRHFVHLGNSRMESVRSRTGTMIAGLLGAPDMPPIDVARLVRAHESLDITPQDFEATNGHLMHAFGLLPEGEIAVRALTPHMEVLRNLLVKPSQETVL